MVTVAQTTTLMMETTTMNIEQIIENLKNDEDSTRLKKNQGDVNE